MSFRIDGVLLTFDFAASTGFAWGDWRERPQFSRYQFPSTGDAWGRHDINAEDWIAATLTRIKPGAVVYEQPSIFAKTTPDTVAKLIAYCLACERLCNPRNFNIPVRRCNPSSVKKLWTGKGNAKKDMMVARAWQAGFRVTSDDEADALADWYFALNHWGNPSQRQMVGDFLFEVDAGTHSAARNHGEGGGSRS